MSETIKCIYSNQTAAVNVNECITSWFISKFSICQGDPLSPTLSGLFLKDLATDIKETDVGIKLSASPLLSILLYVDDLSIIADSQRDFQIMRKTLFLWCKNRE